MRTLNNFLNELNKPINNKLPVELSTPIDIAMAAYDAELDTSDPIYGTQLITVVRAKRSREGVQKLRAKKLEFLLKAFNLKDLPVDKLALLNAVASYLPGMKVSISRDAGRSTIWSRSALIALWYDVRDLLDANRSLSALQACKQLANEPKWGGFLKKGRTQDRREGSNKELPFDKKSAEKTLYAASVQTAVYIMNPWILKRLSLTF